MPTGRLPTATVKRNGRRPPIVTSFVHRGPLGLGRSGASPLGTAAQPYECVALPTRPWVPPKPGRDTEAVRDPAGAPTSRSAAPTTTWVDRQSAAQPRCYEPSSPAQPPAERRAPAAYSRYAGSVKVLTQEPVSPRQTSGFPCPRGVYRTRTATTTIRRCCTRMRPSRPGASIPR